MNHHQTYAGEIVPRAPAPVAVPGAGFPQTGPIQYAPAPVPAPTRPSVFHRLDRLWPLVCTTPLALGTRVWMWQAGHPLGYLPLFFGLSAAATVAAAFGAAARAKGVVAVSLSLAGGLMAAAAAGNTGTAWPDAVMWAVGTLTGYGVHLPALRTQEHRAEDRQERMDLAALQSYTELQKEVIRGQVALGVAAARAGAYVAGEQIKADAVRDVTSRIPTPHVPDADPAIFTLSRTGQRALAEPVTMPAAAEADGIHLAEWLAA